MCGMTRSGDLKRINGREIMRLRSIAVAKRKITIGTRRLPHLTASTAAYLASNVHGPTKTRKRTLALPSIIALAAGMAVVDGDAIWQAARAQAIADIDARVIAVNIPGASAISQVGTFLNNPVPPACAHPIPTLFVPFIQPGAVLDPNRILVGSTSNFGAPLAVGVGAEGSFLSIDSSGARVLSA